VANPGKKTVAESHWRLKTIFTEGSKHTPYLIGPRKPKRHLNDFTFCGGNYDGEIDKSDLTLQLQCLEIEKPYKRSNCWV